MSVVVKYKLLKTITDNDAGCGFEEAFPIEISLDESTSAANWLLFRDASNGKKYKLQITNGEIELVEVS